MRNTKFCVVIMILCLMCSFVACGGDTTGEENSSSALQSAAASDVAQYLKENTQFEDAMDSLDVDIAVSLFNLTENEVLLEDSTVICSTGATAEEIAVFTACDGAVEQVVAACESRVEAQKIGFENYVPKELEKLEDAVIRKEGNKVIFVVCNYAQNAEKLIKNYGL